jgi:hypothetical protein
MACRALRLSACVAIGLILAVPVYVGLAKAGLIRSPFFPKVEGPLDLARSSEERGLRVLFVGNSFTYYNEMPALVGELATNDPGAEEVFSVSYTAPNWTLRKAADDDGLAELLREVGWDVVVLQEQSQLLSLWEDLRRSEVYPAVRSLYRDITVNGGETLLFLTWGYEEGDRRNVPGDTFEAMQSRLAHGYRELAGELDVDVAPVGPAWAEALRRNPRLELWASDGRHPGRAGSYLAACVLYAVLTGRDPTGSSFTGGLGEEEARLLQRAAADVVQARTAVANSPNP